MFREKAEGKDAITEIFKRIEKLKDGKIEGNGTYSYNNGDMEIGEYLSDKRIGVHTKINKKGGMTIINYPK